MAKKGQIYFCEICRQKIEVAQEGFGVLVCCGEDMKPVGEKGMMATWTSVHPKPVGGAVYTCNKCGQKINVVNETTGILECCGERMHREEASVG
ncbi:MAG: desulfoferrodoxin FeS4 iron-binding domain-containing protein [Planctomycetota bacterium]|jgi:desulfoferrodoxin-like iron-binding protein